MDDNMISAGDLYWLDDYTAPNGCRMVRKSRSGWRQTWCETCSQKLTSGKPGNGAGIRYMRCYGSDAFVEHVQKMSKVQPA